MKRTEYHVTYQYGLSKMTLSLRVEYILNINYGHNYASLHNSSIYNG